MILLMPCLPVVVMLLAKKQKQRRGGLIGLAGVLLMVVFWHHVTNAVIQDPKQKLITGILKTPLLFFFQRYWTIIAYCLLFIFAGLFINYYVKQKIKRSKSAKSILYQ